MARRPARGPGVRQRRSEPQVELADRLRRAFARSQEAVGTSERLLDARSALATSRMLTRCAWCGRIQLGRWWLHPDEAPRFLPRRRPDEMTHGICGACIAELRSSGRSV